LARVIDDAPAETGIALAWLKEAERRRAEVESETTKMVPGREVLDEARLRVSPTHLDVGRRHEA